MDFLRSNNNTEKEITELPKSLPNLNWAHLVSFCISVYILYRQLNIQLQLTPKLQQHELIEFVRRKIITSHPISSHYLFFLFCVAYVHVLLDQGRNKYTTDFHLSYYISIDFWTVILRTIRIWTYICSVLLLYRSRSQSKKYVVYLSTFQFWMRFLLLLLL